MSCNRQIEIIVRNIVMKAAQYSETYKEGTEFKDNSECSVKMLAQLRY